MGLCDRESSLKEAIVNSLLSFLNHLPHVDTTPAVWDLPVEKVFLDALYI